MGPSVRFQLLTCLIVYASSAHGIMVKYGTRDGPILPPAPEPELPVPQPYRAPAPVWEERSNDAPDPNATWRPQHFNPHPRYTQVVYTPPVSPPVLPLSSAQRFVNSYLPKHEPIKAEPITNYFTPAQVLSSQSLPGIGLRYFLPNFINNSQNRANDREELRYNDVNSNEVDARKPDSASDFQWKYEKDSVRRNVRNTQEVVQVPVYMWPAYIPPVHQ